MFYAAYRTQEPIYEEIVRAFYTKKERDEFVEKNRKTNNTTRAVRRDEVTRILRDKPEIGAGEYYGIVYYHWDKKTPDMYVEVVCGYYAQGVIRRFYGRGK
jgi:hypothetical protein